MVEKGVIQDATFIIAEPGKTEGGMNHRCQMVKTSRSKDRSWTKKERGVSLAIKHIQKYKETRRLSRNLR